MRGVMGRSEEEKEEVEEEGRRRRRGRRRIEDHLRRLSAYIRRARVWYSRVRDALQGSSSHLTFADGPICENERVQYCGRKTARKSSKTARKSAFQFKI